MIKSPKQKNLAEPCPQHNVGGMPKGREAYFRQKNFSTIWRTQIGSFFEELW